MTVVENNVRSETELTSDTHQCLSIICTFQYFLYGNLTPCLGPNKCDGFETVEELTPEQIDFVRKYYPANQEKLADDMEALHCAKTTWK